MNLRGSLRAQEELGGEEGWSYIDAVFICGVIEKRL